MVMLCPALNNDTECLEQPHELGPCQYSCQLQEPATVIGDDEL